jgi:hypothetical protein
MLKEITTTYAGDHHAFAVLTDTFEQAYVPNSVVSSIKLEVGRTYRAGVVENRHDPKGQTPWFVTFIEGSNFGLRDKLKDALETMPPAEAPITPEWDPFAEPEKAPAELVREAVASMDGEPFLASEVAEITGLKHNQASTCLNNMFTSGDLSCAKIYRSAAQGRSTQTVWCETVERLMK